MAAAVEVTSLEQQPSTKKFGLRLRSLCALYPELTGHAMDYMELKGLLYVWRRCAACALHEFSGLTSCTDTQQWQAWVSNPLSFQPTTRTLEMMLCSYATPFSRQWLLALRPFTLLSASSSAASWPTSEKLNRSSLIMSHLCVAPFTTPLPPVMQQLRERSRSP
jgi:hypothetical protein